MLSSKPQNPVYFDFKLKKIQKYSVIFALGKERIVIASGVFGEVQKSKHEI